MDKGLYTMITISVCERLSSLFGVSLVCNSFPVSHLNPVELVSLYTCLLCCILSMSSVYKRS